LSQLTVIYIGVFCAVLLAVQGAYWYIAEDRRARGAVNRRLILTKQNASARDVFEALRRERGLVGHGDTRFAYLNDLFIQTGLRLDGKLLIAGAFGVGVLFFALLGLAFDYGLFSLVLSALLSAASLFLFLATVRRKRIAKFSEQLPDAIDVIIRGVKSGYPFTVALGLVGKEMGDPIGTELGMTSDEINFGSSIGIALDNLYKRVGHEDLLYLTMALKIQNETGRNFIAAVSIASRTRNVAA
jgi:tight adherence protein B